MILHFDLKASCSLCGAPIRGGGVVSGRVNKRSIRLADRGGLFFSDHHCIECGFEVATVPQDRYALAADSAAEVAAYRERKWGAA